MNDRLFRIFAASVVATVLITTCASLAAAQAADSQTALPAEPFESDVSVDGLERLSDMSVKEIDGLRRKKRQFDALSDKDKKRIRDFHNELQSHADSPRLAAVMNRYYAWLKTLDLNDQIALLDLPVDERLKRIRELRNERARDLFGKTGATKLPSQDAERVFRWIERTMKEKQEQVSSYVRSEAGRAKLNQYLTERGPMGRRGSRRGYRFSGRPRGSQGGRSDFTRFFGLLIKVDPDFIADLIFEDIEGLRSDLSQEAIQIFEEQETEEQRLLVLNWVTAAIRAKQDVSEQTLRQFYETLSPKQRENLDRQTPDTWHRTLRSMYLRQQDEQNQDQQPIKET